MSQTEYNEGKTENPFDIIFMQNSFHFLKYDPIELLFTIAIDYIVY